MNDFYDSLAEENRELKKQIRDLSDRLAKAAAESNGENSFKTVAESATELICIHKPDGKYKYLSPSVETLLGYKPEELVGTNPYEIFHPDDIERIRKESHEQAGSGKNHKGIEYRIRRKDDTYVFFDTCTDVRLGIDGNVRELVTRSRDVTERKNLEREIKRQNATLSAILESTDDIICSRDRNNHIVYFNSAFDRISQKLFGKKAEIGMNSIELLPEKDRKYWKSITEKVLRGETFKDEFSWEIDGATKRYEISLNPIVVEGKVVGYSEFNRDITEQTRNREALERSERNLRMIYENSADIIWQLNLEGDYVYVSPSVEKALGYTIEEIVGRNVQEFLAPEDRKFAEKNRSARQTKAIDKEPMRYEYSLIHKNGEEIPYEVISGPILDDSGDIAGYAGICRNVADRKKAEEKLRLSEEQFRNYYNRTPAMMHSIDAVGRLRYVSDYWLKKMGYARDEVIGKRYTDFMTDESKKKAKEMVLSMFWNQGYIENVDYQFVTKRGEIIDVLISAVAIIDELGDYKYSLAVIKDVTGRKKAEKALAESEETLRTLVENQGEGVGILDAEEKFVFVNPAAERIFGFEKNELIGKEVQDFAVPRDRKKLAAQTLKRRRGESSTYELEIIKKGAGFTTLLTTVTPQFDENGNYTGCFGVFRDISHLKEVEKELRNSKEALRMKLDRILSPEYDVDEEDFGSIINAEEIQSMMEDFYETTGIPSAVLDAKGNVLVAVGWQDICTKFHRIRPETQAMCLESDLYLTRDIEEGEYRMYKCRNNLWDAATPIMIGGKRFGTFFFGQYFFEDEKVDREFFEQRAEKYGFDKEEYLAALDRVPRISRKKADNAMRFFIKFSAMIANLSYGNLKLAALLEKQKRIDGKLRETEKELRETIAAKNKFFSIIAHDLRAPFSGFLGLSETLSKDINFLSSEDLKDIAGAIHDSANSMYKLLDDLLTWSQSQIGSIPFKPKKVKLREITGAIVYLLSKNAEDKSIELISECRNDVSLNCDRNMAMTVMRNLVSNAIKFTEKGGEIRISCSPAELRNGRNFVKISVSDSGVGMKKEILENLFAEGSAKTTKGTRGETGTGLGLIICKEFVERHGGEIEAESEVGVGSVLSFTLPAD